MATSRCSERGRRAAAPLLSTPLLRPLAPLVCKSLAGAALLLVLLTAAFALAFPGGAAARELPSRLGAGNAPPQLPASPAPAPGPPVAELVPLHVLSAAGPLAADGAGQLFMLAGRGDGYDLLRLADARTGEWETVYRRKASVATSLALGWDGTICIGLLSGVDCIDPSGRVAHHSHELFTGIVSLALAPDRHLWVLRSASGATTGLELVRATPGLFQSYIQVSRVLSLRQSVRGFAGNGLAATAADGSALIPVIENDIYRVLCVRPDGSFSRIGDFWSLGGAIALAQSERLILAGTKRPESLAEQRAPVDVIYAPGAEGGFEIIAAFPQGSEGQRSVSRPRLSSFAALGGNGTLYVIRHEEVRAASGPPFEAPVLWQAPVGLSPAQGGAKAIAFSIPHIASLAKESDVPAGYAGPLLVARSERLVIEGINFDGKLGERQVLIGGVRARVEAWDGERIVARVPATLTGGPAEVRVGIDFAVSDPESFEVKTPDTPGWFQIGSPAMQALLADNLTISGYTGLIEIVGATESGEIVHLQEVMETPGFYHARLPNGLYTAHFKASYLFSDVRFEAGFTFAGARFVPVQVEEQAVLFRIGDDEPVVVWMPEML